MSVGDLFKPIWKNSNSAVRLQYVQKIAESSRYNANDPSVIKILKHLAIFDSEKEINELALRLITDPKILKETVLEATSAAQKFAFIRQIEANTIARINDIHTKEVPGFLNLIKDEKIIKDILILHPEHLALGLTRITHEEHIVAIIEKLNLIESKLAETYVELISNTLGKISSYEALQRIEAHINTELQNTFKSKTGKTKIIDKLQQITENIKKKISSLPEYQEEIKKQALLTEVNDFNQKLNNELLNLESLVNTPINEVDRILNSEKGEKSGKEPPSLESISDKWNELKTNAGEGNLGVVFLKTDELIDRYQNIFPQWLTLLENGKRFQETLNRLTALIPKTSALIPEATPQNFDKLEYFQIDTSEAESSHTDNSHTDKLEQALSAHQDEWNSTYEELARLSNQNSLLEKYSVEFNDEVEKAHTRIAAIKNLLSKQHTEYQQTKEQLESITDNISAIITEVNETTNNVSEQPLNLTHIADKVNKLEEQWKQVFHESSFSPELSRELFSSEQESFNNNLKKFKKSFAELEQKKQKLHQKHLDKLNQELKTKIDHTEKVLNDYKGKDGKKTDKKIIRELFHELQIFEKIFTLYRNELNTDLIQDFDNVVSKLKAVVDEIEEDFTRLQSINLQKKQKLCEVLESLNEVEDKTKLAFLLREAEMKWKNMGSVNRNIAESIQNRFNEIVNQLNASCEEALAELDKKISAEISTKENLITELEAFTNSVANTEQGWREATNHINAQIEKWKEIKVLSHEQNLQLNVNFKKQLDRFYERRNEFYTELKSERGHTIEAKRKLLAEVEKLAEENNSLISQKQESESNAKNTEWFKLRSQLIKLTEEWYKLGTGFPYNENNKLNDDLNKVYESILASHKEDIGSRKAHKEKLLTTLQEVSKALGDETATAKTNTNIPKELTAPDIQETSKNTTTDDISTTDENNTTQPTESTTEASTSTETKPKVSTTTRDENAQLAVLQRVFNTKREWDRIAPLFGKNARKLNSDFYGTYRKILQNHQGLINKFDQEKQAALQKKQALLQELEAALASDKDSKTLTQHVIDIQAKWKQTGHTAQRRDSIKLEKTFYHLTNQFFKEKKANYQKFQDQRKQNYTKKMEILTRVRYLVESNSANTGNKNSTTKNQSDLSQNIMDSPEQLKLIWEMNRQLRNNKENTGKQNTNRAVYDELRNLREQWKNIGSANSDRALNDEFFALLRKAHQ